MALPDSSSLDTYGGARVNYRSVEDPLTDIGSEHWNPLSNDVAMLTQTGIRAWVVFTGATYTGGTQLIIPDSHGAMWGSSTGVRPVVDQTAIGVYHTTWAASQFDLLGASHTINIRMPQAPMVFGVDGLRAKIVGFTANVITLNTFSGGAANALNGTKIGVAWL